MTRPSVDTLFGMTPAQRRASDRAHAARRSTDYLWPSGDAGGRQVRRILHLLGQHVRGGGEVLVEFELPRGAALYRWRVTVFPAHWGRPVPLLPWCAAADAESARAAAVAWLDATAICATWDDSAESAAVARAALGLPEDYCAGGDAADAAEKVC